MTTDIRVGDCLDVLRTLDADSVQTCVTSPPYFGLRDYGVAGQIGLESTPHAYVAKLVDVFREVRRVLRPDATLWLNLGDSYNGTGKSGDTRSGFNARYFGKEYDSDKQGETAGQLPRREPSAGLGAKQLLGIPWRVAFALQADGWYLRSDIIWAKPNPMPESVTDRPTKAHEYLFLLAKAERYYYDAEAIFEDVSPNTHSRVSQDVAAQIGSERANGGTRSGRPMKAVTRGGVNPKAAMNASGSKQNESFAAAVCLPVEKRNKRTVWTVADEYSTWAYLFEHADDATATALVPLFERWEADGANRRSVWTVGTQPYSGAHFATFPPALIEPCILAGSRKGETVLDPFGGAGTTGLVADRLGRNALLIELNPAYAELARRRIVDDAPLFNAGEVA